MVVTTDLYKDCLQHARVWSHEATKNVHNANKMTDMTCFVASWRHIPRGLVTGAIIVISASDKSLPRWVICTSDRERERERFTLKMKH